MLKTAEFFGGMGLVRLALESEGFEVVFANDIEPIKERLYSHNFGSDHFVLGDVRDISGNEMPDIDLATASFPCTDLSLAGNRRGFEGMAGNVQRSSRPQRHQPPDEPDTRSPAKGATGNIQFSQS